MKELPWQEITARDIEGNTHFPASMREKLQYLGTASGRDEDKVKGADLTLEFTKLGNPIFAEADLAIECKKVYAEQFRRCQSNAVSGMKRRVLASM